MYKQLGHLEQVLIEPRTSAPCIGRLAGTDLQGAILVEYDGYGPFPARMICGISRKELSRNEQRGREVLLIFEKDDTSRPVIIGLMEDPLDELISFEIAEEQVSETRNLVVDGKRITIEAEDEILLKCGKGSIQIRKDGKIVIKGSDLLSRSSGPQRIRGASVNIN